MFNDWKYFVDSIVLKTLLSHRTFHDVPKDFLQDFKDYNVRWSKLYR